VPLPLRHAPPPQTPGDRWPTDAPLL
jgi:hypothetical protein